MAFGKGDIAIYRNLNFNIKPEHIQNWELGRQEALYTIAKSVVPENIRAELETLFHMDKIYDAWHVKIQSDIPKHTDPTDRYIHYRYNICLEGSYWFNLEDRTYLLEPGDVVLFRSDISAHGVDLFEKNLVEIFSVGIFIEQGIS